ncbi:MAG: PrsW family intramembrane metalloprotease [Spirochaetales bacterium]|nr:PrsW family intramembrane metalloprotease [Spirochaetales bacterium]
MILIISIIVAVLPALLLVLYFYKKDKLKKEPKGMIVKAFILGVLSIIPAAGIGLLLMRSTTISNPWLNVFFQAFIVAGLIEEFSKFLVFRLGIFKSKYFDEVVDGIIYMAVISLGFACLENIMYSGGEIGTGLIRAFTAVPGHAIWSGIMGYYFGLAVLQKEKQTELFIRGLFWGVLYHGTYDVVLFIGIHPQLTDRYMWVVFLIIPILIGGIIHLHRLIKKALKMDEENTPVAAPADEIGE